MLKILIVIISKLLFQSLMQQPVKPLLPLKLLLLMILQGKKKMATLIILELSGSPQSRLNSNYCTLFKDTLFNAFCVCLTLTGHLTFAVPLILFVKLCIITILVLLKIRRVPMNVYVYHIQQSYNTCIHMSIFILFIYCHLSIY